MEVKSVVLFPDRFETSRLDGVSRWYQAMKVIALCLRLKSKFQGREVKKPGKPVTRSKAVVKKIVPKVTVSELQEAEKTIIRCLQYGHFHEELQILCNLQVRGRSLASRKSSSLHKLDPFVDQDGLICVGGRIRRANVPIDMKHQVIIPQKGHLTNLLIRHHLLKVNHMGHRMILNELCVGGYWLISGSSAVLRFISSCVTCRQQLTTGLSQLSFFHIVPLISLDHSSLKRGGVMSSAMEYCSPAWGQEVFTWRLPIPFLH